MVLDENYDNSHMQITCHVSTSRDLHVLKSLFVIAVPVFITISRGPIRAR